MMKVLVLGICKDDRTWDDCVKNDVSCGTACAKKGECCQIAELEIS